MSETEEHQAEMARLDDEIDRLRSETKRFKTETFLLQTRLPERFTALIDELGEDFDEAASYMLGAIGQFVSGESPLPDAQAAISRVEAALIQASGQWVEEVLPQVYAEGARQALESPETRDRNPVALAGDIHDEAASLHIDGAKEALAGEARSLARAATGGLRGIAMYRLGAEEGEEEREQERHLLDLATTDIRGWGLQYAEELARTRLKDACLGARESATLELGPAKAVS